MSQYWDQRYLNEGKIWGDNPSKTAIYAQNLFSDRDITKILIPGSGTGRNTKFFSEKGYNVTGIEISQVAYKIAIKFDIKTKYINDSILDYELEENYYDAVYCFNLLHLFLISERRNFIYKIHKSLKSGGFVFFTVFSMKEPSYGKGLKLETNTYESKSGRPTHYFDEEDMNNHFSDFVIIENNIISEKENHGDKVHTHHLRILFAQKR